MVNWKKERVKREIQRNEVLHTTAYGSHQSERRKKAKRKLKRDKAQSKFSSVISFFCGFIHFECSHWLRFATKL